jgi:hypothetical protein
MNIDYVLWYFGLNLATYILFNSYSFCHKESIPEKSGALPVALYTVFTLVVGFPYLIIYGLTAMGKGK